MNGFLERHKNYLKYLLLTSLITFVILFAATSTHGAWYDGNWSYRKQITIKSIEVTGGPHSNFPVLISRTTDTELAANARNDGYDILFTSNDEFTKIAHEIEKFDGATGELAAWVKVGSVSSTGDTIIYMYYGNPSATDQQQVSPVATEVWDSNYKGVWHLKETGTGAAGEYKDSTTYANGGQGGGGTASAVPSLWAGTKIIGDAQDFDGSADFIEVPSSSSLNPSTAVTVEAWVNVTDTGDQDRAFVVKGSGSIDDSGTNPYAYALWSEGNSVCDQVDFCINDVHNDGANCVEEATAPGLCGGGWHHLVGTYDGTALRIFIDGSPYQTKALTGATITRGTSNAVVFGRDSLSGSNYTGGAMDEVRISDIARSAEWIKTSYDNQNNPANFVTVGSQWGSGSGNQPPNVNAGSDKNVTLPASASLSDASANDPDSAPGPFTTTWSEVSGPGTVTFGDASAVNTTASFSQAGTYVLKLTADDGLDTTEDTLTITVNSAPAPPIGDYSCNMQITIDNTKVSGSTDFTDFPVLISLTDDSLKNTGCGVITDSNGYDIIFTDSTKTIQLDHEIEKYDGATGEFVSWVRIPTLSATSDTDIYMYYGNSNISSSQENAGGLWVNGYEGVWHLKETTGTHYDSTSGNNGTPGGGVIQDATGKIGGADDFDGIDDYVEIGTTDFTTTNMTLSAWVKADALADHRYIFGHTTQPAYANRIQIYTNGTAPTVLGLGLGDTHSKDTGSALSAGSWYHVVLVKNATNYWVYLNSALDMSGTYTGLSTLQTYADIGNDGNSLERTESWNGVIDEVRISDVARSADWIKTSYNNQNDPSSFYSVIKNCAAGSPPPISEYSCSLPITIDSTKVSGSTDLTNFPVLIDLTKTALKTAGNCGSVQNSNGYDIIFSDSTQTTQLDHELVSYDGTAGSLVAWVRVPTLSATSDTVINLHFGHASVCGPTENPTGVWDANYAAVWHLDEDAATATPVTIDERISYDADDSEERISSGAIDWTSSDLELGEEGGPQIVGMRWRNITIPQGSTITSAYVEFTADEVQTGTPVNLTFWGEDADNAAVFQNVSYDISNRTKTSASVAWNNVPTWPTVGETHQSPDISPVIQEIVNRPGWASGNALVVLVTGSGRRTADSHNSSPATAALLHVEYTPTPADFHLDSTSNDNDGLPNGNTYNASGKIAGAQTFDGVDDWIEIPNSTSLDITGNQITLSAWVKMNATQTVDAGIINKSYSADYNYMLNVQSSDQGNFRVRTGGSSTYLTGTTTLTAGQWYFLYGIYDGANAKVYLNGSEDGTDVRTGNIESSGAAPVVLGRRRVYPTVDNRFFNGVIDEARISNVARSTDWMITEYNNQNDPSSFYSVGSSSCALSGFTCNRKITIPQAKVSGSTDLQDFPLLIKLDNDCKLRTVANGGRVENSNGWDIIFTAADGVTQLDHELVKYDGVTGDYVAWVRVPTLSASSDTEIYMYYGKSSISCDPSNPTGVWDSNYKGVWHLDETSGTHYDSTSNDNDATPQNGVSQNTVGKIDGADDFDGIDDYVDIGQPANGSLDFDELSDFCISAWFKADTADHNMTIVGQRRQTSIAFGVYDPDGDKIYFRMDDSAYHESDNAITLGDWYHAALCYDYVSGTTGNSYLYVNGVAQATNPLNTFNTMTAEEWRIGDEARWCPTCGSVGPEEVFDGIIDEVRISDTVRSVDWFKTSYDNQRDPSSFYIMSDDTCGGAYGFQYTYCNKITVDNTQVSGSTDFSDFPLLVNITNNNLRSVANGGRVESDQGYDIVFKTSGCGVLDHEIEKYDPTTGQLIAWVKIPTLYASSDTEIYMYYGDSSVDCPTENPTAVWDANYQAVYHLKEDPSGTAPQIYDSTANDHDGTSNGGMTSGDQVAGQVGGGIDFDSTDDYIDVGNFMSSGVSQVTLEAWVYKTDADDVRVVSKSDGTTATGTQHKMTLRFNGAASPYVSARLNTVNNVGVDLRSADQIAQDTWTHVAWTYDGSAVQFYIDGASSACQLGPNGGVGSSCTPTGDIIASTRDIVIGNNDDVPNSRFFGGIIDEVRISDIARSANWIATQYTNQSNPNFYSVGSCFEQTTVMTDGWEESFQ